MSLQVVSVMKAITANQQNITGATESNGERFFDYQGNTFSMKRIFNKETVYVFSVFEEGVSVQIASEFNVTSESRTSFSSADTGSSEVYAGLFNALTPKLNGVDKIFKKILDAADDGI